MTNETMMKGILHALNSIASSLNPEYKPLDERIYDNEQRLFIINEAKKYINQKRKEYNHTAINSSIRFDVNYQIGRVACTIFNRQSEQITHKGIYQFKPDYEVINEHIAAALALANALDETIPWADNIPQPHAAVIGHSILYQGSSKTLASKDNIAPIQDEFMTEDNFMYCAPDSEHAKQGRIHKDTDAQYGRIKRGESDL